MYHFVLNNHAKIFSYFRNVCVFLRGESSKAFASDPSSSERRMSNLLVVIVLIICQKVKNTQIQKSKRVCFRFHIYFKVDFCSDNCERVRRKKVIALAQGGIGYRDHISGNSYYNIHNIFL